MHWLRFFYLALMHCKLLQSFHCLVSSFVTQTNINIRNPYFDCFLLKCIFFAIHFAAPSLKYVL